MSPASPRAASRLALHARRTLSSAVRRAGSVVPAGDAGQTLPIVLGLVTLLFLLGGALAAHASTALRAATAAASQADDLYAADAGFEVGVWWQRTGQAGNPPSLMVNGRTVTTTVTETARVGCLRSMNPIRMMGFEHGASSTNGQGLFTTVTGTTVDGTVARSGSYSLRAADISASSATSASWTLTASPAVIRFAIRLPSLPVASVTELASVDAASGSRLQVGYNAATGRLVVRVGGSSVSSSAPVVAGTWHVVDLRYTVNANPRTVAWQVDAVEQPGVSSAEAAAASVTSVRLGSTVVADVFTASYDDLLVSATSADYPLGTGQILPLRPNASGNHAGATDFEDDDGTPVDASSPGRLTDAPMTSNDSFVRQVTASTTSYLEVGFADTAAPCIGAVGAVIAYHSSNSSLNDGRTIILDGPTSSVVHGGDMASVQLVYRSAVVPPSGGSWTSAEVSALVARIGFGADVSPAPSWDALLLEYATGTPLPASVTVVASAGGSTVTGTYDDAGTSAPNLQTWTTTR